MQQCNKTLKSFFGHEMQAKGLQTFTVECCGKESTVDFVIVDCEVSAILGYETSNAMGLVRRVHTVIDPRTKLINDNRDVFGGLGAYDRPYDIHLDPTVETVVQPRYRVPYSRMQPLKDALDSLAQRGVIAEVNRPTEWVHNLVVTEKTNGSLRICLDPQPLNEAIKRERFQIPTPEDVQAKLSGCKVFSVVDMKDSYWQVRLTDEASFLCTFHAPWGRKRFLRMPFGISSASEVMQKRNEEAFSDLHGVHVIADDIIVAAPTEEEHDACLQKLIDRAREKNVKFNPEKLQYKVLSVQYMGNIVSDKGLAPSQDKVRAIQKMPRPTDKKGVQRFLGMVRFLSQFVPNMSQMTAPLRNLLKEDVVWEWTPEAEMAFNALKEAISRPVMLQFFDATKQVRLEKH